MDKAANAVPGGCWVASSTRLIRCSTVVASACPMPDIAPARRWWPSHLIVEKLRRGMAPKDAGIDAVKRVRANTVEKRLLNARGLPNFG